MLPNSVSNPPPLGVGRFNIQLFPAQMSLVKSQAREILYSGGYGSGKSYGLCCKLLTHAVIPGNLCLLARKHRATLKHTTLRTLLVGDGNCPPVLPFGSYEHNESKSLIHIMGGGDIIYMGFDDDIKLRSLNLGAAAIDEGIELSYDGSEYMEVLHRLRNSADPCRQMWTCTNPGGKSHFLYRHFFEETNHNAFVIECQSTENTELPQDYVDSLKRMSGAARDRYLMGKWCDSEGLVYPEFNTSMIKDVPDIENLARNWYIGIDVGRKDPCALLLAASYGSGEDCRIHIVREIYKPGLEMSTTISDTMSPWRVHNPQIFCDPSAGGTITDLNASGWTAEPARNKIAEGVQIVRNAIGCGHFSISPSCVNLIREISSYSLDAKTGLPAPGQSEHACDACRYLMQAWSSAKEPIISPGIYIPDENDDDAFSKNGAKTHNQDTVEGNERQYWELQDDE